MTSLVDLLTGDGDPASLDGYPDHPPRMGFFTDTSVCIGCKACEVACKEWNHVPEDGLNLTGMSYDNTDRREGDSRAWKCTLCYDRIGARWSLPAPRPAPPTRSSSARWTSCGNARPAGWQSCTRPALRRPGCTARTPATASAATARSSCCSTSRRSTACRPDPVVTTRDLPAMWRRAGIAAATLAAGAVAAFAAAARGRHG